MRRPARQADCHPGRKYHALGLCRECYREWAKNRPAKCHPERRAVRGGKCSECLRVERDATPGYRQGMRDYMRRRREADPDFEFRNGIRKLYGLTVERYREMLADQGGACAICG